MSVDLVIRPLEPYMFSVDAMLRIASIKSRIPLPSDDKPVTPCDNLPIQTSSKVSNLWIPPYHDKLFWCFYYIMHGDHAYIEARKHAFRVEREAKITTVELLRTKMDSIKKYGFKLDDLEEELVICKRITYKGLYALCMAHDISLLYVKDRTFMEIGSCDAFQGLIVIKNGITGLRKNLLGEIIPTENEIIDVRRELLSIPDPTKPIRSLSAYGLGQLVDMAQRLEISIKNDNGKKKLKKVLYEEILSEL